MSDAIEAINSVLNFEGTYFNDPVAGPTNFGISLRFLQTIRPVANVQTIKDLTVEQATSIYKTYFWDPYPYKEITNQTLANLILNLAVNTGTVQAHKLLQRAIRPATGIILVSDGVFGQDTTHAVAYADAKTLILCLRSFADAFYRRLPNSDSFLAGWLNRLYAIK